MITKETTSAISAFDENANPVLPTGLNILTILTFIGCAVFGLFTLLSPIIYKFFLGIMDKAVSSGKELTEKELADMAAGRAAIELASANLVPGIIVSMIGIMLCLVGALWMRKFKKDGYWLYVAGQLIPVIGGFFLFGSKQYTGIGSYIIGIGIPLIFILLYTLQRKYLTK